jgi:hypothetical protein
MMRKVFFVKMKKNGFGRSYEGLVCGALDTTRIVAVQAGGYDSRFDSTVKVLMDEGREFTVKGRVDDWIDLEELEEPNDPE